MRETLFRGKTEAGEWVYGDYFADCDKGKNYIREFISDPGNGIDDPPCTYQQDHAVDPGTVGQYTGLKDLEDKKIFEGDIVKNKISELIGHIVYRIQQPRGITGFCVLVPKIAEFNFIIEEWRHKIGNIHDNPELLETK